MKRLFFRVLLSILNTLTFLGRGIKGLAQVFTNPVFYLLRKVYRYIVFPFYRFTVQIRKRLQKSFGPAKNKYLYPLIAKPLVHITVVVLIFAVTAANLQARTLSGGSGQNSILFELVNSDEGNLIEETAEQTRSEISTSYLAQQSYGVSARQINASNANAAIPVSENLAMVTNGGSAMVSTSPFTPNENTVTQQRIRKNRTSVETYIVQSGDTISTIASKFGISSNTILWANNLGPRDYIKPNQELKILPVSGVLYTVKKGDTVNKLANSYDVGADEITSYNKLSDDTLTVGNQLIIPNGVPPRSATPTQVAQTGSLTQIAQVFKKPTGSSPDATSSGMIWPVPGHVITQYYGWKHTGVDIDGDYVDPIYASDSGVVEIAGWGTGYGIQALVNHENGIKTRYGHMSKIFVVPGQRVSKGEIIGMVGTTGNSTGTHLHYEVYVNGSRQNPLLYIR